MTTASDNVEIEEHTDGGVTVHVEPPEGENQDNGSFAAQAIRDAARAEIISERAEETATEAQEHVERIEEQCRTLLNTTEAQTLQIAELTASLEQTRQEHSALLQRIASNTENASGSPMLTETTEEPTLETLAEAAEITETTSSETPMEPSSETKTEAHEESAEGSGDTSEAITLVHRPRVLMY